jgi:plastocyanin
VSGEAAKVIIPTFSDDESSFKYFIPRFAKIQRGEFVQWTNLDNIPHSLVFYTMLGEESRPVTTLGPILPNTSLKIGFPYDFERIDYYCDYHRNEMGSVIIFSQNEETMTNTQRLHFLSRIFNINPPEPFAHLRG